MRFASLALDVNLAQPVHELVNLTPRLILCHSVALLQLPNQLIALPIDRGQVVIGQLAPLFLQLPGILLPLTFYLVPIHGCLLFVRPSHRVAEDQTGDPMKT